MMETTSLRWETVLRTCNGRSHIRLAQTPRGIRGYQLLGGVDFDQWKIQGNLGGEDFPDKVRGPLNEGGLFVEREGLSRRPISATVLTHFPCRRTSSRFSCDVVEPVRVLHSPHWHR